MSLESDLAPRLEKIEQLTRDRYEEYYADYMSSQYANPTPQTWRLTINPDGVMVPELGPLYDPVRHGEALAADLEHWGSDWQRVSGAVSDLVMLFQRFYVIDLDDTDDGSGRLEEIWRELGGRWQHQRGPGERETGRPPDSDGGTAYDQLAYARYYMDEEVYNQLLRIRDEEGYGGYTDLLSKVWEGPAAAAFFHTLVVPFDEAAARQIEYVRSLAANIEMLRRARNRVTHSLRQLADNCIASLAGDVEIPSPDADDINDTVGLLTAVAGLLTASGPTPAALAGAITLGIIGLGSAVVSIALSDEAKQEEDPDHIDLTVAQMGPNQRMNPGFVIESCQDAVGRVKEWIATKDECAGRALERDRSDPYAYDSQQLWLREPGEFSGSVDFDLADEAKRDGVSAPIDDLREAGRTSLPDTVAGLYDGALKQVARCTLPAWVGNFLPRTYGGYHSAQDRLVHLLGTTRDNLRLWGDELVEVANDYEATDGENARTVGGTME